MMAAVLVCGGTEEAEQKRKVFNLLVCLYIWTLISGTMPEIMAEAK